MRRAVAILAIALPLAASALPALAQAPQPAPATAVAAPRARSSAHAQGGDSVTRAEYVERAATNAGRRFDAMDTAHTGTLTREQMRAWRQSHRRGSGSAEAPAAAE